MKAYKVWCEEYGESLDDAMEISIPEAHNGFDTISASTAATVWAKKKDINSAEYNIASGNSTPKVHVQSPAGSIQCFEVYGRCEPFYTARKIRE